EKIEAGERLDFEDGVALMESDDLLALGELADLARRLRGGGDEVFFIQNLYLNQTNVCRVKCKFCAFAKTQKQEDAYTLTADGLGSLPGGGAEIFADRVRKLIAPGKEHPDEWFDVHDHAHRMGIPTHCTLLYGHVETYEERVDHLLRLRAQQDETGGFLAFIPLAFHPENTVFERRGFRFTTGADDLKMIAVSRLLLDNIPNIKAYWTMT